MRFFNSCARGWQQAYDSTAFAFQAQQTFKGFEATLTDLALRDFTSSTWTRKVIGQGEAKLDGEIVTAQNGKVLIAVVMTKEDGGWKLYALRTPTGDNLIFTENKFTMLGRSASFNDAANKTPPTEQQLKELVSESLLKFNSAIQMENFSEFYNYVSVAWQSQLLERQLKRAFQPFIDRGMNIDSIRNSEPVFDEPAKINRDGILVVNGHCPAVPLCVVFSLKYVYELPKWKLYAASKSAW